jgi:hypothetical protein
VPPRKSSEVGVPIPTQVSALLQDLTAALPTVLGMNLVGIYLYGSLTQCAFDAETSDVDCVAVTEHELTDLEFTQLDSWLARAATENAWVARLQLSLLIRDEILMNTTKGNCLFQLGRLTRVGSDGNPIIWMNVLETGIVLYGPPASSFVPRITAETLFAALLREVGYLREAIIEKPTSEWRDVPKYRAYAVLTLCRILYSHRHGAVVSKPQAAEWALNALPDQWHNVINQALEAKSSRRGVELTDVARFIEFVDVQLRAGT